MHIKARDSIYTDSNDDTASRDGHAIKAGHTVQEKINAYSAIALGVIGFAIFFFYYLSPLVKAHKKSKVLKRRQELLKAISIELSYDLEDEEPKVSKHHATPERVIARDSIGVTKARQAAYAIDLNPFLSKFPSPPDSRTATTDMQAHSPTFEYKIGEDALSCPSPTFVTPQTYSPMPPVYSLPQPSSFVGLPSIHSFSPSFVISDSEDSISSSKTKKSLSNTGTPGAQGSLKVNSAQPPTLLYPNAPSSNRVCGIIPPRSSSLNALLLCSLNSSKSIKNQTDGLENGAPQLRTVGVNAKRPSEPLYADDILPRYLRESADSETQQEGSAATSTSSPGTNITSMPIQDNIFTRAARGLIGGSPPRTGGASNTELKFEMSHFF